MTRFLLPGNKKEKLLAKTLAKLELLSAGDVLASWRELEHNCERMLMGSHYGRLPHAPGSEVRKQGICLNEANKQMTDENIISSKRHR